jgi:S-adenosylhomocysteine hydrolase
MIGSQRFATVPLLDRFVDLIGVRDVLVLQDVGMVCVQHLLETTGSLFEKMVLLGLNPMNVFVLGKVYSTSRDVENRLRDLGINVFSSSPPALWGGYEIQMQREIQQMWQIASDRLRKANVNKIIVLDDGGCALASVPAHLQREVPMCGVEQTMSGISLQDAGRVPIPVVQVAMSAAKKLIEPPLIQEAIFNRIKTSLRAKHTGSAGVVGVGSIGQAVLNGLIESGKTVHIYDVDEAAATQASGIVRCASLQELFERCDFIFGCSGKDILREHGWWKNLEGEKLLVSCSSHDREFRSALLSLNQTQTDQNKLTDVSIKTSRGTLIIVRGGFPANFDRSHESVPARDIQLTRALLLAGVLQASEYAGNTANKFIPLTLKSDRQAMIVNEWLSLVPERRINYAESTLQIFGPCAPLPTNSLDGFVKSASTHL